MAQWDDGYVTDVAYTASFYREITPAWLAMTSLLLGHRPPDLARPFAYADIGCGNGFTTLTVAATCPHAEVWGFDFNPAHIEFARNLAREAELTNVHFVETSFADLAALPAEAAARVRYHGLARRAELDIAGQPRPSHRYHRSAAETGRPGLSQLQCHHRLELDGAGARADAHAGDSEPAAHRPGRGRACWTSWIS